MPPGLMMENELLSGRYRLDAILGQGGMGAIYRAYDTLLDREVAVKLLSRSNLGTEGRARLLNEARAVARLHHPNIVTVFDAGEANGSPYIVMELIEGQTLHDHPPRDLDTIVAIAIQLCAALEHAHVHGIIHRDLKPENVIVTPGGTAKLADFGLARSIASRLTGEGTITGTVFYLAPELALGQPFDGRADLYALGVMLYELTTGHLPFIADDPLAVISQHLNAPVVPPRSQNPSIPLALDALIVQLMAKRPEERPATAADVRYRLEHLDEPTGEAARATSMLDRIARGRFVARQRELAEAENQWRRACAGEGCVLLISGEPGIGKTRFVLELMTQARVSGGRALMGECYADGGAPYAPIAQMIRDALDSPTFDFQALTDANLADLLTLAPDLQARFPQITPSSPQDPPTEPPRVFESIVALCAALCARAPLLIFIDDAHWADSATLSLLRHLARRTRKQRLLIVATYREVELDSSRPWSQVLLDLNRERLATRVKLTRLSYDETCDLLCALFQEELKGEFVKAVYRETEGNPFFVEEVIKSLVEEGKLVFQDGRWLPPDMDEIEIPQSVKLAIQARVAKLSDESQETLRLATVLGREFDFDTLRQASELDEDALIAALESAERAQLIEEAHPKNGRETFGFAHALIRLTLWEGIGRLRRKRLHRRAAAALEAIHPRDFEQIAQHYRGAGDPAKARAYYLMAGERALSVYAGEEAERSFRVVLELGPTDAERLRALAGLGESLAPRGRHQDALGIWQEAIALARSAGDYALVARLYTRSAQVAWVAADMPEELALARAGLAAVEGCAESPELAALVHETARACYFNGLPEEGTRLAERALDMARRLQVISIEAQARVTLGLFLVPMGRYAEARRNYEETIELAERASLYSAGARAHHNLATLLMGMGRFAEARAHAARSVELMGKIGDIGMQMYTQGVILYCSMAIGDYAEMERAYERLLEMRARIEGAPGADHYLYSIRVNRLRYFGNYDELLRELPRLMDQAHDSGDPQQILGAAAVWAETLFEVKRYEEALAPAQEAAEIGPQLGTGVEDYSHLASVYARLGQVDQAHDLLRKAEARVGQHPIEMDEVVLTCARARVAAAEKDWPRAFEQFQALDDLLRQIELHPYRAHILAEIAGDHLERGEPGDREQARSLLNEALALYERCNCSGLVAKTQGQLKILAE